MSGRAARAAKRKHHPRRFFQGTFRGTDWRRQAKRWWGTAVMRSCEVGRYSGVVFFSS